MHLEAGKCQKSQRLGAKALNIIFADGLAVIFFGRSFTGLLPITLKETQPRPGISPNPIS